MAVETVPTSCGSGRPTGLDTASSEAMSRTLRALADAVRLRLFTAIAAGDGPVCVCDLPDVGVSQPTVSHHLRKLREAGLVECERRGTWIHYAPTEAGLAVARALAGLAPPL